MRHANKISAAICILFAALSVTACSTTQKYQFTELYSSLHCGFNNEAFSLINNKAEYLQTTKQTLLIEHESKNPEVDFLSNWILLVSAGEKPNVGYSIYFDSNTAYVNQGSVLLPAQIQTPDINKLHAQMITRPCKVISIPKGNYNQLIIKLTRQHRLVLD